MFGSCFDKNCLETRAYTLSAGVSFRGTPGSQLFQIDGGIQVAIYHQVAAIAGVNTITQVHLSLDMPTMRTSLRGRVKRVGQDDLTAIPLTFVHHLPSEFVKAHIRNRLSQVMVL